MKGEDLSRFRGLALRARILSSAASSIARADIEKRLRDAGVRIAPRSLAVLRLIDIGAVTNIELSRKMLVAPATLVPMIDSLEEEGLIRRVTDAIDRRRNVLILTKKGMRTVRSVQLVSDDDVLVRNMSRAGRKRSEALVESLEDFLSLVCSDKRQSSSIVKVAKAAGEEQRASPTKRS